MNRMLRVLTIVIFTILPFLSYSQIFLDESFDDWQQVTWTIEDKGDVADLDIEELAITNDESFIYLKLEFNQEILLQTGNQIQLIIKGENYEINYTFGERVGSLIISGSSVELQHEDIGMILSPTVTSREFEIQLSRTIQTFFGSININNEFEIAIRSNSRGNDKVPDSGFIQYVIDSNLSLETAPYQIDRDQNADFRLCSYNIFSDGIFDNVRRDGLTAMFKTINADIYMIQESYDFDGGQVLARLDNTLGVLDNTKNWYAEKEGRDLVIISAYPIKDSYSVDGAGIFILDVDGQDVFLCNVHLSCCDKDDEREDQIDELLNFIRDSKDDLIGGYHLTENTPIIIAGDMNFVGNANQVEAIRTGNIFNNSFGPDFPIDWDDNGLTDLRPFTTGRNSTYTWYSEFSNFGPGRLDYLFYSDHTLINQNDYALDPRGLTDVERLTYDIAFEHGLEASDHLPIVSDFKFRELVSTIDSENLTLRLYPNPAIDNVFIESMGPNHKLELTDIGGRSLKLLTSGYNRVSDLSEGIYLVRITNTIDGNVSVRKLFIY